MAFRRYPAAMVLVGLVLVWKCYAGLDSESQAFDSVVADFNDPVVAAYADALGALPASVDPILQQELPAQRPRFPSQAGYSFCTYDCASSITIKTTDKDAAQPLANGILYLDLTYKPILGVTSSMMTWLFESLTGYARYQPENKMYPMYLIFHPRDHVATNLTRVAGSSKITPGSIVTWCEMILTNCKYNKNAPAYVPGTKSGPSAATAPWVCPAKATGYNSTTPAQMWQNKYHTKENMRVTRFNRRSIEFTREENNAAFQGVRSVATTQHTWSDVNNGTALQLRTRLWISLMKANSTTEFDTDPNLAPIANSVIKSLIFSGADNLQNGNATQLAWMNALHFLEEYGGLKSRLPQIYRGRRQPRFYKPRD